MRFHMGDVSVDTVRESALEVDSGRKVPSRTGDSDPTSVSIAPDFSVGRGWEYRQLSYPRPGDQMAKLVRT